MSGNGNGGLLLILFKWGLGLAASLVCAYLVYSANRNLQLTESVVKNQMAILAHHTRLDTLERRLEKHEDAKAHPEALAALAAIEARLNAHTVRERQ